MGGVRGAGGGGRWICRRLEVFLDLVGMGPAAWVEVLWSYVDGIA